MTPFPFEAVVFDLDGTLVATERYWPDAARVATRAFAARNGLALSLPTTSAWLAMVGRPMDEAFEEAFPRLDVRARRELLRECREHERDLVERGRAALLPGVEDTLSALRARGVRVGVASNCGHDYLNAMMGGLGLDRWVEEPRCLQSPGIGTKADMIEDLSHTFGTRSLVMVGDRRGDRDAAWANGVPHVHVPRGYGGVRDEVAAEAHLDAIDQLIPALEARGAALDAVLEAARADDAEEVVVDGLPLAGRTILARDLERRAGESVPVREGEGGAWRVEAVAAEDVLERRALGQRVGPAPADDLRDRRLPSARARLDAAPRPAFRVDLTNAIEPAVTDLRGAGAGAASA